jgi:MFS family permease
MRIVPFLFACYIIAMIDRLNVGFAKLQYMSDLHFTEAQFGASAGLLYLGYILFEVPSNLLLQRSGIRLTLLRIMVLWGLVTMGLAFANTKYAFYCLRFTVGLAEAGFLPGVLYYFTLWFPDRMRARVTSIFVMALPIAGVIGGPIAGLILTHLDGTLGLRGWQYLFILEGLPAVVMGVVAYSVLANGPAQASWLTPAQRVLVAQDIAPPTETKTRAPATFAETLKDPRVYGLAITYFVFFCVENALLVWIPTLLKFVGVKDLSQIGWISGGISLVSAVGMIAAAFSSDFFRERRLHVIGCGTVAALTFLLLPLGAGNPTVTIILLSISAATVFGFLGLFWTIPAAYFRGTSSAGGIAFISSIGAFGGFVSPVFIGQMKDLTGSFYVALGTLGGLLLLSMVLFWFCIPVREG